MSMVRVSAAAARRVPDVPPEGPGPRLLCALLCGVLALGLAFAGKVLSPAVNDGDDLAMLLGGWAIGGFHGGWVMRRGLGAPGAAGLRRAGLTAALCTVLACVAPIVIAGFWIWKAGASLIFATGTATVGENLASLILSSLIDGGRVVMAPMAALPYGAPLIAAAIAALILHASLPPREA